MPGNWTTTLETMKALEGHRGHMTHIQFHSYGGGDADENTFNCKVAAAGRLRQRAPEPHGRRRPGAVRRNDEHDRRRPARLLPGQRLRQQVVQRRHRNGSRLRHRPDQVQEQEPRPRAAMGDRPGMVSAGRRPVAGRDEHRPSQRRLVPGLSADHPPADGPQLSRGDPQDVPPGRPRAVAARRPRLANTR